jgi:hypothetical protein
MHTFLENRSLSTPRYKYFYQQAKIPGRSKLRQGDKDKDKYVFIRRIVEQWLYLKYGQGYKDEDEDQDSVFMRKMLQRLSVINKMSRDELVFLRRMLRKLSRRQRVNWFAMMDIPLGSGSLLFKRDLNKELQHRNDLHKDACRATTAHQAIVAANVAVIPPTTI